MEFVSPTQLIPLEREPLALFARVRDVLAQLADAINPALLGYAPIDLCAEENTDMLPVVSALNSVVHAAIVAAVAPDAEVEIVGTAPSPASAAAELDHALRWTSLPTTGAQPPHMLREYARTTRIGLVRDVGAELCDARCRLVRGVRGVPMLSLETLSPVAAQALRARRVLLRADKFQFAADWPLLLDELEAAQWMFSSWAPVPPNGFSAPDFRRWERRGSEWGVAERPSILFGGTLTDMLATRPFNVRLRPRQCAMARALAHSFSGVFRCESLGDGLSTFTDLRTGSVITVMEHRQAPPYDVEWLGFGRLVPLGDEQYFSSDGMVFMSPNEAQRTRAVERACERLASSLTPTLAVEAALSAIRYDLDVPRSELTWIDAAWARDQLARFRARWLEYQSAGAGPVRRRGHQPPPLDVALTGWVAALEKVAMLRA